ncbi:MAG: hypothetical protein U0003_03260 [Vampirovibrionales bacterium]
MKLSLSPQRLAFGNQNTPSHTLCPTQLGPLRSDVFNICPETGEGLTLVVYGLTRDQQQCPKTLGETVGAHLQQAGKAVWAVAKGYFGQETP